MGSALDVLLLVCCLNVVAAEVLVAVSTIDADPEAVDMIDTYTLDLTTGDMRRVQSVRAGVNPSFFALVPGGDMMVAVSEGAQGAAISLSVDRHTGALGVLHTASTYGNGPCFIQAHPSGDYIGVAHYNSGDAAVLPFDRDTGVLGNVTSLQPEDPATTAHAHDLEWRVEGAVTYCFVTDLGLDRVWQYVFHEGVLAPNPAAPYVALPRGSGPRHLAFHPTLPMAYLLNELDSTVAALAYSSTSGTLKVVQILSSLHPHADPEKENAASEIAIHPAPPHAFLVVSNRGHNTLTTFAISATHGNLTYSSYAPSGGNWPRNFAFDVSGRVLLCANERSDNLQPFAVHQTTGILSALGHSVDGVSTPRCVLFLPAPDHMMITISPATRD